MTIREVMFDALTSALYWFTREALDEIRISNDGGSLMQRSRVRRFGVNWAALGTVTPEEARHYGSSLTIAASLAEALNRMELVVDYTEDDSCTAEEYELARKTIYGMLVSNSIGSLREYLQGTAD